MANTYLLTPHLPAQLKTFLTITLTETEVESLSFTDQPPKLPTLETATYPLATKVATFWLAFFNQDFNQASQLLSQIPLKKQGTAFQNQVWEAMKQVPVGKTRSYLKIAEAIQRPKAFRAVGSACGKNPVPILVPCHRIVGSNNQLGGFAGKLALKKWLLNHESVRLG